MEDGHPPSSIFPPPRPMLQTAALFLTVSLTAAPPLLPEGETYDPAVPAPNAVLGFDVGDRHLRHDQLVTYLKAVAAASDRVTIEEYAVTHGGRPNVVLTVTAPANRASLAELPAVRANLADPAAEAPDPNNVPAVLWAGYSVHGDEASAGNAAALVAYHLAASTSDETARILDRCVILLDPCLNPDGFDRFAAWANAHRGRVPNPDPDHREHNQPTPTGRTNGYWFDLNRDWLPGVHPESRGRLELFYKWRPNVVLDFHEMGPDSTYFFQPGVPERNHPLTPARNLELTKRFAEYTADVFDAAGEPYFTGERFDDFYMGKGSTYPDLHGAVGILYEQASARGLVQEGDFGEVTFAGTVANQVRGSLSAFRAAADLRGELNGYLRDFYERGRDLPADAPAGYLIEPSADPVRNAEFPATLARHGIRVETTGDGSLYIGLDQPESRFARALFGTRTNFRENIFYDISAWTLPDAFGLRWQPVDDAPADRSPYEEVKNNPAPLDLSGAVAVLIDNRHGRAVRTVYELLAEDVRVRAASEPFSAPVAGRRKDFGRGTYLIHLGRQREKKEAILTVLQQVAADGLPIYAAGGGLTPAGVDLGSGSFLRLERPRVALAAGDGVSQYGTGAIWHALDFRRRVPCTLVEPADFGRVDWTDDTILILPDGNYRGVSDSARDRLRTWVRGGGTIIAVGTAGRFLKSADILDLKFGGDAPEKEEDEEDDAPPPRRDYANADDERALELVSGAIFTADPDVTHPLLWGVEDRVQSVFINNTLWPARSPSPYGTPLMLSEANPLKAGYASGRNRGLAAGSAYLRADRVGRGRVVYFAADPCFRGFWHGTERLLANAVLLAPLVQSPSGPPEHTAPRVPPKGAEPEPQ